ncbi:STAS domain-containing protein [Streptomyces phaeochromogenes]
MFNHFRRGPDNTRQVDTELAGQGVDVLDHLLGEQGCAGGDAPDERYVDPRFAPAVQLGRPRGPDPVGVIIDLTPTDFFDAAGLRRLVRAHRRVTDRAGHLLLVCPHPRIHRILQVTRFDELFYPAQTLDEALTSPSQPSPSRFGAQTAWP